MPKDYYLILGISRGADINQIKRAYRKIAKRHHPDITRSSSTEKFMEIKEAYETLRDARLRQKYDRAIDRPAEEVSTRGGATPRRQGVFREPAHRFGSVLDEFFEGLVPGLFFNPARFDRLPRDLFYEVVLSRSEAYRGGLFPVRIPVLEYCPQCNRRDTWSAYACPVCDGHGFIRAHRAFSLSIPPRTPHGTQVALSLEDIGLKDTRLFVHVLVDPWLDDDAF